MGVHATYTAVLTTIRRIRIGFLVWNRPHQPPDRPSSLPTSPSKSYTPWRPYYLLLRAYELRHMTREVSKLLFECL